MRRTGARQRDPGASGAALLFHAVAATGTSVRRAAAPQFHLYAVAGVLLVLAILIATVRQLWRG